ncbi:SHOCT domain-containing protein [Mesoaciditoga sp.]
MFFFWPFWWYGGYAIWSILWNLAGIIIFLALLYAFFHRNVRWSIHHRRGEESEACEILKRRYAAGEINKEEYEEVKRDLGCK